jgi:signal peptidase II
MGGAVSNIIDRILSGCVIDFIDLRLWPVFNLADTFIVIGAIIIVLTVFRDKT